MCFIYLRFYAWQSKLLLFFTSTSSLTQDRSKLSLSTVAPRYGDARENKFPLFRL